MIEAKPNTRLRSEILSALFHKGYAGPNYNLDDVSAYVTKHDSSLSLSFWDMSCTINKKDKGYTDILNAL
jgi:hypothetical protein